MCAEQEQQYVKVVRHCPRCRVYRYHMAALSHGKPKTVKIVCAECGHQWGGRYKKDEWK